MVTLGNRYVVAFGKRFEFNTLEETNKFFSMALDVERMNRLEEQRKMKRNTLKTKGGR